MDQQQYSLPELGGLLSFPTQEIMEYGLDHSLIESPGLLMHIVLGRILVFHLAKKLPQEIVFDIDTAMSLTTVYHATRQSADYAKAGRHIDPKVNEFMQNRGDMDYALQQAREHGLSSSVLQGIQHYLINPSSRESGYFPHETLSPNGKVNWTEAIPMLTSWIIAGAITRTDKRFKDLRDRRSGEIGKLELPYWHEQILLGNDVALPKPIVDTALVDGVYKTEQEIVEGIREGKVTNEIMGKWILDGYEEWANNVVAEYCKLTGIEDFYGFLESGVDTIGDTHPENKQKIKASFEAMLGRKLADDEFIPYIDGIDRIFDRIKGLKTESTRYQYRVKVTKTMLNIEPLVRRLSST